MGVRQCVFVCVCLCLRCSLQRYLSYFWHRKLRELAHNTQKVEVSLWGACKMFEGLTLKCGVFWLQGGLNWRNSALCVKSAQVILNHTGKVTSCHNCLQTDLLNKHSSMRTRTTPSAVT